jgi:RNA polymerase sigma-70 factor (ECF subfamily)
MTTATATPAALSSTLDVLTRSDFARAIEQLLPSLRGYARRLTQDAVEGDDLVQDALTRAWAARAQFRVGTSFGAWLFRILRNGFLSRRRRSWREITLDRDFGDILSPAPADQETTIFMSDLDQALAALPTGHRDALLLVTREGLTYDAVAEALSIPVGTVRSRVFRARVSVMTYLQGERVTSPKASARSEAAAVQARRANESTTYRRWKAEGSGVIG